MVAQYSLSLGNGELLHFPFQRGRHPARDASVHSSLKVSCKIITGLRSSGSTGLINEEVIAQLILALGHFTGFATNEELTGILVELSSRCCGIARPNQLNQDK
jgi:hypothetical protein